MDEGEEDVVVVDVEVRVESSGDGDVGGWMVGWCVEVFLQRMEMGEGVFRGGEGGVTRPPTRIRRTHNTNFLSLRMYPHWTLTTLTSTMDSNSSYYFICLVQSHAV